MQRSAEIIVKTSNATVLTDLCNSIDIEKQNMDILPSGRIPCGFVAGLVAGILPVCLWATRDKTNNECRQLFHLSIYYKVPGTASLAPVDNNMVTHAFVRVNGGHRI